MSILSKIFGNKPSGETAQEPRRLSAQEKSEGAARAIYAKDKVYVPLSAMQADVSEGTGIPYIGRLKDGRTVLYLFETYEAARAFSDGQDGALDGIALVGALDKADQFNNLSNVLRVAHSLGIQLMEYRGQDGEHFECALSWLMRVNGADGMAASREKMEALSIGTDAKLPLQFHPIAIVGFSNPYKVTPARAEELFKQFTNVEDEELLSFFAGNTPQENVLLIGLVEKYSADLAKSVKYIVWNQLAEQPLFVGINRKDGGLYARDGYLYLFYTDRFQHMGPARCHPVSGKEAVLDLVRRHELKGIALTDGLHNMARFENDVIFQDGE